MFHLVDGSDAFWFSLPAHILFPQRTTQFAYSLDVAILLLLFVAQAQIVKPKQAVEIPSDAIAAEAGSAKKDGTTDNAWSDDWVDFDAVKTASSSLSHRTVTGPSPAKPPAAAPRMPAAKRVEEVSNANMSLFELIGPISPQQKFALHLVAGFATGLLPLLQVCSCV